MHTIELFCLRGGGGSRATKVPTASGNRGSKALTGPWQNTVSVSLPELWDCTCDPASGSRQTTGDRWPTSNC